LVRCAPLVKLALRVAQRRAPSLRGPQLLRQLITARVAIELVLVTVDSIGVV